MNRRLFSIHSHAVMFSLSLMFVSFELQAEIRIGLSSHADAQNSGIYVWARAFASELQNAGMSSTIYPGSSLGNEIARSEQVLLGLLEVNITGSQETEVHSELMGALNLPFLLAGADEADALFQHTGFLEEVNLLTRPAGVRVVDLGMLGGMVGLFTARKPIRAVADVKEFRLRAMSTEQLNWVKAWGGAGTQVAWEEVPQALLTGIADGYMNPPIVAVMFGHGAQLDFFTNLQISPSFRIVVLSEKWYQGLSEDQRIVVKRALTVARQANRAWLKGAISREFQMLDEIGIEVIQLDTARREEFQQRLIPGYKDMVSLEVIEKISLYLEQARLHIGRPTTEVPK